MHERMKKVNDSNNGTLETTDIPEREHQQGQCKPLKAFSERTIDSVVAGSIVAGALQMLNAAEIKVYWAVEGTISENLEPHQRAHSPQFAAGLASDLKLISSLRGKFPCSLLQGTLQLIKSGLLPLLTLDQTQLGRSAGNKCMQ